MALTHSTEEAIDLLKATRKKQIEDARRVARKMLARPGSTTHTRDLRLRMLADGVFDTTVSEFWLGAVFRHKDFEWTGEYVRVPALETDVARNIHDRKTVKVWRLRHA